MYYPWFVNRICPTGNKINGELFLELEEDEEFLRDLNLSLGFKRRVKRKAKEVSKVQCHQRPSLMIFMYYEKLV